MGKAKQEDTRKFQGTIPVPVTVSQYEQLITGALKREYPERHARKTVARLLGVSARTADNWFDGANAPRGAELLRLMSVNKNIADEIFELVRGNNDAPLSDV